MIDDVGFHIRLEPERTAGANYSMHAPDPAQKVLKPVGQWNTTRLVVRGSHVEHWLNEKRVVEFERWTPAWNTLRDSGKWKEAPEDQTAGAMIWTRRRACSTCGARTTMR